MDSKEEYRRRKEHGEMDKKASPKSPILSDCIKAFLSGDLYVRQGRCLEIILCQRDCLLTKQA